MLVKQCFSSQKIFNLKRSVSIERDCKFTSIFTLIRKKDNIKDINEKNKNQIFKLQIYDDNFPNLNYLCSFIDKNCKNNYLSYKIFTNFIY